MKYSVGIGQSESFMVSPKYRQPVEGRSWPAYPAVSTLLVSACTHEAMVRAYEVSPLFVGHVAAQPVPAQTTDSTQAVPQPVRARKHVNRART